MGPQTSFKFPNPRPKCMKSHTTIVIDYYKILICSACLLVSGFGWRHLNIVVFIASQIDYSHQIWSYTQQRGYFSEGIF
jgi:hypothetical protein